jgi:hypothetical protein
LIGYRKAPDFRTALDAARALLASAMAIFFSLSDILEIKRVDEGQMKSQTVKFRSERPKSIKAKLYSIPERFSGR